MIIILICISTYICVLLVFEISPSFSQYCISSRHQCAELLGGLPTGILMDAIAGMLMRPDLVASAVVQSHLVELLAYMLSGAQRSRGKQLRFLSRLKSVPYEPTSAF